VKHSNFQPLPRAVRNSLPVCPLCKQPSKWAVYDKMAWTTRGYRIVCEVCGAEWEYTTSEMKTTKGLLTGLLVPDLKGIASLSRATKIADDETVWALRKAGNDANTQALVNREMKVSEWKRTPNPKGSRP